MLPADPSQPDCVNLGKCRTPPGAGLLQVGSIPTDSLARLTALRCCSSFSGCCCLPGCSRFGPVPSYPSCTVLLLLRQAVVMSANQQFSPPRYIMSYAVPQVGQRECGSACCLSAASGITDSCRSLRA